ncbi:MAG: Isoleucine-tRNA ligase [Candidatus Magasanikbacteria bacterium GW2011_GWC2_34_16]|uniref:Isoleucine--tRNA ligase n=2 Tax=Candidatus Magasanikiibacteriota TaxID=1752731 RepID=A0A0G0HD76_9BACT|nr:MAG: Isoleucine-tRNA ligase [Candidatus Magasanikbacteria bacterium GW2011_GWC2_34_16]KKQ41103.1 MAG: Isoleucine-tRNA ligase [Candidatus Magasanikbacteria bacterium GW2011_GWA2_37_8]
MYNANDNEKEVLKFWEDNKIFEKSVSERPEDKPYVFYDGPPFATGLPHYGHIVASLMKDVVPRYWTMQGKRVERRWGWDCHGLPVENIIEKELNLNSKKDIEEYGVAKFNEACRATVLKYAEEWKKTIKRMGRWVDMENDYKTMDLPYMESVWWVFKQLWDLNLIYKGHKAMHICPRCVTPLSNFEVTQGYKDVKDISVTMKFCIKEQGVSNKEKLRDVSGPVYILAWTTTPWTLPGNVLLAVGSDIDYVLVKVGEENLVLAKDRLETVLRDTSYVLDKTFKGSDLIGLEYEPLFPYFVNTSNAFRVVGADFVTTEDGTGVVHIAPAFGEDDYNVGKREGIPLVQHVKMDGRFVEEVEDFAGHEVKPREEPTATDVEIIKWLAHNGKLFSKEKFEHSYPHCWRCDTPLLNYATNSWFIKVTELKEQLLKNNKDINWVPEHIKEGRFGLWLEGARDWAVSRNRFWGTPLPVWENEDGEALCIGNVEELEQLTGAKITDLHKHKIDDLEIKKDGKVYKRIPEVLDCWFESGSMPYGQMHYPFENKTKFEAGFPAEFIAEGQDQTRGWFYTLHILATALTSGKKPIIPTKHSVPAFRNVIVNGIVLAEDGKKMSKRLKNYPEPDIVLEKYGADAMRYYLVTSPVMAAEGLNFSEIGVREVYSKLINTLWNVVTFYEMFASEGIRNKEQGVSENILDKWILAKLQVLIGDVTKGMEGYRLTDASRPILDFVTELSQWYVRRSRDRFKGDDKNDALAASDTLGYVLLTLSKLMAPFTPFIAEKIYKGIRSKEQGIIESVHLETWPEVDKKLVNEKVLEEMILARKIVEMGLAARAESGVKVRQPLQYVRYQGKQLSEQLEKMAADELNVKEVKYTEVVRDQEDGVTKEESEIKIRLNTVITPELKREGLLRELVRGINQMRKEKNLTPADLVTIFWHTEDKELVEVFEVYKTELIASVKAKDLVLEARDGAVEIEVGEGKVMIALV